MILPLLLSCITRPELSDPKAIEKALDDPNSRLYSCIDVPGGMSCRKVCKDGSRVPVEQMCPSESLDAVIQGMSDVDGGYYNCLQGSQKPDCFERCEDGNLKHITEGCGRIEDARQHGMFSSGRFEK